MNRQQAAEYSKEFDKKFEQEYENHWKGLLTTHGKFDEKKIKNELRDLCFIYDQVGEVYLYITGGQLSKAMYYSSDIKTHHDDTINKCVQEEIAEQVKEGRLTVVSPKDIINSKEGQRPSCETKDTITTFHATEKELDSFETWLELFLFHHTTEDKCVQPAFDKVEIVKTLKDTFMTKTDIELEDNELELKVLTSQEDNIIKAINRIYAILYGLMYPNIVSDKMTCLDDLQDILIKIDQNKT